MYGILEVLIFAAAFSCCRSHAIWEAPGELHPVHGLYVKPSSDGTTGDLYVAATEENGVQTQWLTDQPVNFLSAATSLQPKTVPLTSSLTKTQEDKTSNQKRAILTSPAVKYAYALPVAGAEGNVATYPYAIPTAAVATPAEGSVIPPCSTDIPVQPYPYQYFYPHMMSAIASAVNSYKDSESNEEKTPLAAPTPYWPYGYPYQYVFVDPNAWAQSQANPSEGASSSSSEGA